MADSDHPYKRLFRHPEVVADLLRAVLPPDSVTDAELAGLEPSDSSFVSECWQDRESDVLWRLPVGGHELWVYLLIELQSSVDAEMPVRMAEYQTLLYRDLITGRGASVGELPPILPIVIYNGEATWTVVRDLGLAIAKDAPPWYEPYRPTWRYLLLDLPRMSTAQGLEERNLAAAFGRLEQCVSYADLRETSTAIAAWLASPRLARLRADFAAWFARTLSPQHADATADLNPFTEYHPMLAERIQRWNEEIRQEGRQEGRAEGAVESILTMVADGICTVDQADVSLRRMHAQGMITPEYLTQAITRLRGL